MSTMRHAFFSTHEAQVCIKCGARYGRCEHTAEGKPNDWGNLNLERRRYYTSHRQWRSADVERLRVLWNEQGLTSTEIAKQMGRSRAAICSAARRFGMDQRESVIDLRGVR